MNAISSKGDVGREAPPVAAESDCRCHEVGGDDHHPGHGEVRRVVAVSATPMVALECAGDLDRFLRPIGVPQEEEEEVSETHSGDF